MKTHSNGCKPRIAITLSGWITSPSIRSLIAIAPTIVFKSFSGESTCSELDYEIPNALPPSVWGSCRGRCQSGENCERAPITDSLNDDREQSTCLYNRLSGQVTLGSTIANRGSHLSSTNTGP